MEAQLLCSEADLGRMHVSVSVSLRTFFFFLTAPRGATFCPVCDDPESLPRLQASPQQHLWFCKLLLLVCSAKCSLLWHSLAWPGLTLPTSFQITTWIWQRRTSR